MDAYETTAKYNIAETCAASISLDDLQRFSCDEKTDIFPKEKKLTYGSIQGSDRLRSNLAQLYTTDGHSFPKENILVTNGAISANFNVLYALVGTGDHVICHYPTYQQLYSVPASLGAEVDLWKANPERNWQTEIADLEKLIRPNTKVIIIKYIGYALFTRSSLTGHSNPQNPTGALIHKSLLSEVVALAKKHNIVLLSDEVYRPLFHSIDPSDPELPPSSISMGYEKTIATGSMSKAFALAGIRVGWIASNSAELIKAFESARDYTLISVSQVDDAIASFATSRPCIDNLLARNIRLAQTNVAILQEFVQKYSKTVEFVRPVAGSVAMLKFSVNGKPVDDVEFCKLVHERKGVLLAPGHCFGEPGEFAGYVRFGFVCETEVLVEGLKALGELLEKESDGLKLA